MTTMVKVFFHNGSNSKNIVRWCEDEANEWLKANGGNAQVTLQTQMTYRFEPSDYYDGDWLFTLTLVLVYP
jgi:hypothetical protein